MMSRTKGLSAGLLAGLVAAVAMTVTMLLLASVGIATPLVIIGDRLSVFISPGPFLSLMGKVGGYNHLKQLGVASTIAGQLLVGGIAGTIFGLFVRGNSRLRATVATISIFVLLPIISAAIALWPVLGTHYRGLPIDAARLVTHDGSQYKGGIVQPITPNDSFYCVTKNIVDPRVNVNLLHLEVTGLVQNSATYRFQDLQGFTAVEQETTLMCISNGLDAGLISNAVWKGVPLHDLLDPAVPVSNAARVRLWGVDNYSDTIPLEKAMDATTLVAYEMNGAPLPHRHGYPARVVVPGYFGEKHVKWLTRIEVAPAEAKGFYETQGWGPDFIVPTRSRIDGPDHESSFFLSKLAGPIEVKGIAFGGDRGISRVELSFDDGKTWDEASIYYAGSDLAWSLWKASNGWTPKQPGDYTLVVRATDGEGDVQEWESDRSPFSGATGFHKIVVHVTA